MEAVVVCAAESIPRPHHTIKADANKLTICGISLSRF
jgi:hypothetical protein